jgi:hypothetical protein
MRGPNDGPRRDPGMRKASEPAGDRTRDLRIKRTGPMPADTARYAPMPHGACAVRPGATRSDTMRVPKRGPRSMKFELGAGVKCDLQKLIDTRALIQANSGGGKSHTLRRLLEQTHGKVQQLVIDPEGEFSSLREKGDYILAAKTGGDTAADPRAAKLLAERLLQLGVSAILDIYELKAHERIRFVRAFLEALVDAPEDAVAPGARRRGRGARLLPAAG